jgi:hypothetical protein
MAKHKVVRWYLASPTHGGGRWQSAPHLVGSDGLTRCGVTPAGTAEVSTVRSLDDACKRCIQMMAKGGG